MRYPRLLASPLVAAALASAIFACSDDENGAPASAADAAPSDGRAAMDAAGDARHGEGDAAPDANGASDAADASSDASDAALPVALDPTFGDAGAVTIPMSSIGDGGNGTAFFPHALAVRPDGRVVIAGLLNVDEAVLQLTADGARLDPTFGDGGIVRVGFRPSFDDHASAMALRTDGKIVVGYACAAGGRPQGSSDMCVTRLTVAGALDTTFGDATGDAGARTGTTHMTTATSNVEADADAVTALAIDGSGRMLFGGTDGRHALVGRLSPAGAVDPTFAAADAGAHVAQLPFGGQGIPYVAALGFQSTGRLLAASSLGAQVVALGSDGAIDATFGGSVGAQADAGAPTVWVLPVSMAVLADDSVVLSFSAGAIGAERAGLARFTSAGAIDVGFGGSGVVLAATPARYVFTESGGLATIDGDIYVAGSAIDATKKPTEIVWKVDATGAPVASFGPGGFASAVAQTDIAAITVSGGKILTAGVAYGPASTSWLVVERITL